MRLFKIYEFVIFNENSGIFRRRQKVTFSGYLHGYGEVVMGYMMSEPLENGKSLTFYVKGYREKKQKGSLLLLQTTMANIKTPITMCSYFPCVHKGVGFGFLDDTDGIPSEKGRYFFIGQNSIAQTEIKIEPISDSMDNKKYKNVEKKMDKMLSKLYSAQKRGKLNLANLLNVPRGNLIDTDP